MSTGRDDRRHCRLTVAQRCYFWSGITQSIRCRRQREPSSPCHVNLLGAYRMGSDSVSEESPERLFRTFFISDVHLGARGSQANRLLDFLRTHDADTIYLVGDIVDGWALKSNWYWPQSHTDFVQKMLRKARKGAKVVYVPGNHDEFLRNYTARISAASTSWRTPFI